MDRISREWSDLGKDPNILDICWFSNTAAGDEAGRQVRTEPRRPAFEWAVSSERRNIHDEQS
jgi:hypothetical protein